MYLHIIKLFSLLKSTNKKKIKHKIQTVLILNLQMNY